MPPRYVFCVCQVPSGSNVPTGMSPPARVCVLMRARAHTPRTTVTVMYARAVDRHHQVREVFPVELLQELFGGFRLCAELVI